jgi:hypothetical protein
MALTHIGAKALVTDIDTDSSVEAKTCKVFYDEALEFVLSDVDWGFARARESLSLLSEDTPDDWEYVYSYPNDCMKARQIFDSTRRTVSKFIPFEMSLNVSGDYRVILTDQVEAKLRYTKLVTNPTLFSPAFSIMMSYYIGYLISYPLTKKSNLRDAMQKAYQMARLQAEVSNAEEEEWDELPDSELLSVR